MWWVGHLQEVALLAPVPRSAAWAPDTGSRHLRPQQLAAGVCIYQVPLSSVPSHAVNLLGNLPVKCLDVLLTLEPHEGSLEFLGVNMDVIRVLLSFMEKRLHQVGRGTAVALAQVFPATVVTVFLLSALVRGDQLPSVIQAVPPTSWSSQIFLPEKSVGFISRAARAQGHSESRGTKRDGERGGTSRG